MFYWESLVYFTEIIPNHGCGCIPEAWLHSKSPDAVQKPKVATEHLVSCSKDVSSVLTSKEQMKQFSGKKLLVAGIKFKMNKSNSSVSAFSAVLFSVLLHCDFI